MRLVWQFASPAIGKGTRLGAFPSFCDAANSDWIRWFVSVWVALFGHVFQVVGRCLVNIIVKPVGV